MSVRADVNIEAAILELSSVVRRLLADAERSDILARHRVGSVLREGKRGHDTYGTHAIERVAAQIGVAARLLYRYIVVAETWSEVELRALVQRTSRFGQTLTWSHFVALSIVRDPIARAELFDECLVGSWSVRELAHRVDELSKQGGRSRDAVRPGEAVLAALTEGLHTAVRAAADLRTLEEALAVRLVEADVPTDEALLARAEETFEDLRARAGGIVDRLRGARSSGTRIRCAVTAASRAAFEELEDEETAPPAELRSRVHTR